MGLSNREQGEDLRWCLDLKLIPSSNFLVPRRVFIVCWHSEGLVGGKKDTTLYKLDWITIQLYNKP